MVKVGGLAYRLTDLVVSIGGVFASIGPRPQRKVMQ